MTKKIAILGSAPSSVTLAPFGDPSWQIWACSPGCWPHAKRVDAWFEIHRWEPGAPWFSPEYIGFMAKMACPVYMIEPVKEIPASVHYPIDAVMDFVYGHMVDANGVWREKRFDRSDFSSSIAWMIALAIIQGADEIGLWGVDMSAQEEWFFQRSGCQSLVDAAKSIGIKITCPNESDLLRPPPLYGFCEIDPAHIKYVARRNEIQARINHATQVGQDAQRQLDAMRGAMDQLEYNAKTWVGNPFHLLQDTSTVVPSRAPSLHPVSIMGEAVEPIQVTAASTVTDDWRALEREGVTVTIPSTTTDELLAAMQAEQLNGAARLSPSA